MIAHLVQALEQPEIRERVVVVRAEDQELRAVLDAWLTDESVYEEDDEDIAEAP